MTKYCDFSCKYADFPRADIDGACRKEISVWCKIDKIYHKKNSKCPHEKKEK